MQATGDTDPREAQRALYGAPVAELVAIVTASLRVTQGRLAEVLGLSAPMLSQLVSGHRVKIGNPAVVHRLQALLDLAEQAPNLSAEVLAARLSQVREQTPTLTGAGRPPGDARHHALEVLRASAGASDLEAAALATAAPELAALLREAAAGAPRG